MIPRLLISSREALVGEAVEAKQTPEKQRLKAAAAAFSLWVESAASWVRRYRRDTAAARLARFSRCIRSPRATSPRCSNRLVASRRRLCWSLLAFPRKESRMRKAPHLPKDVGKGGSNVVCSRAPRNQTRTHPPQLRFSFFRRLLAAFLSLCFRGVRLLPRSRRIDRVIEH